MAGQHKGQRPVGASRVVVPGDSPDTVLDFLCQRFPGIAAPVWRQRLQQGKILDQSGQPLAMDAPCVVGMPIYYFRELDYEPEVPFTEQILFQNDSLLVVDKPHFLTTAPVGNYVEQTLLRRLQRRLNLPELAPVHRLDRLTAGVLLFCKQPEQRDLYQALFRNQQVDRLYEALAPALPQLEFPHTRRSRIVRDNKYFFRSCEIAGEPNSETCIEVLQTGDAYWHYRLRPATGHKHQLRVHMNALGAPILGDDFYPCPAQRAADDFSQPLQLLARSLTFTDPLGGEVFHFESSRCLQLDNDKK